MVEGRSGQKVQRWSAILLAIRTNMNHYGNLSSTSDSTAWCRHAARGANHRRRGVTDVEAASPFRYQTSPRNWCESRRRCFADGCASTARSRVAVSADSAGAIQGYKRAMSRPLFSCLWE